MPKKAPEKIPARCAALAIPPGFPCRLDERPEKSSNTHNTLAIIIGIGTPNAQTGEKYEGVELPFGGE